MKNKHRGELLLFLTSFIWGFAFIAQKLGSDYIPPFTFNFLRNLTAGLFLLIYSFVRKNKTREKMNSITKTATIRGGITTGLVMAIAVSFQQTGVYFTTSGKAGFITSLYVVIVPIIAIFMGKKVSRKTAIAIILALIGLYLLTVKVEDGFSINKGDILIFIGSLFFAFHILFIDHYSIKSDSVKMSMLQFFVASLVSLFLMILFEKPELDLVIKGILAILYLGVFSSGLGYTLQIVAQKDTDPTISSLILSLEAVFAALFGFIFLKEVPNERELIGGILMFFAIILAQLPNSIIKKIFK
ncbi:MAG: DMT family transporter [Anaerococcus hydrogenalis]|uniref:DMT family transporter n=1 Tax=Anaerococcus hydrogenalis TaxID=33029 RepID=UPI002903532C|nr:DMT family transporter [Anaerococcus hydrogenalis]MDU2583407.1 DMT family transporter [Anaerococcus hydrogenalis]